MPSGEDDPDRRSGTYLLVMEVVRGVRVQIGGRRELEVLPGWYAYVGSAFGPGGVTARCRHHRRPAQRPHPRSRAVAAQDGGMRRRAVSTRRRHAIRLNYHWISRFFCLSPALLVD